MDSMTKAMGNARLDDQAGELEELLFKPQTDSGLPENALNQIPRYLFRVVSPRSDGEMNETWVRSESAYRNRESFMEDIFFGLDTKKQTTVARTLNLHLRWWPKDDVEDNFVSWTSSLLFALQYIYYRNWNHKGGSKLEDIKLYVIDTTRFSRGTFIRDLDLIDTFREFDNHPSWKNLENFQSLRNDRIHYFGEYLSQGALKIAGKHQMVSAKLLFDGGLLRRLQPLFPEIKQSKNGEPEWVKGVLRLRNSIWLSPEPQRLPSSEMVKRLGAVGEIADRLEPDWRFPIAIYFAALISQQSETKDLVPATDNVFLGYFQSKFSDGKSTTTISSAIEFSLCCYQYWMSDPDLEERTKFEPSNCQVIAPDEMPELKRVQDLVREIHKDSQLKQMLDDLKSVEKRVLRLHRHGSGFIAADTNEVLASAGQSVLSRLRTVQGQCEEIAQAIQLNGE